MKKSIAIVMMLLLAFSVFTMTSCSGDEETTASTTSTTTAAASTSTATAAAAPAAPAEKEESTGPATSGDSLMVGMVTDSGTIDDRSFNQGTWEGVKRAADELGLQSTYLRPNGTTTADYTDAIYNLYDQGYRFIACPGYLFEEAIIEVQAQCPDLHLVIFDSNLGDNCGPNTVSVSWKEQESGFLAGVATAVELIDGSVGFVGGIEIPAVQKFNWGFQQGVAFANDNYGTTVEMAASNFVYSGSFADLALGGQLATAMYDSGVDVIFAAAGGTGVGVINEAKSRRLAGQNVWAVGVDVDQYTVGDMGNGESCILTSAMKYVDKAAYDLVYAAYNNEFPGGTNELRGAATADLGIPETNPNLSAETMEIVAEVEQMIIDGSIVVQDTADGLIP